MKSHPTLCQFHQHFTRKFYVQKSFRQLFLLACTYLEKSCQKDVCMKNTRVKCWWNWHLGGVILAYLWWTLTVRKRVWCTSGECKCCGWGVSCGSFWDCIGIKVEEEIARFVLFSGLPQTTDLKFGKHKKNSMFFDDLNFFSINMTF